MKRQAIVIAALLLAVASAAFVAVLWLQEDTILDRQVVEALAGPQPASAPPKPSPR